MKKFLMLFVVLLMFVQISYSAEPIIEMPPSPTRQQLELYEDSDELYALELMKYYNYALTYQIQYMLYNPVDEIKRPVPAPTFEQINDPDAKLLAEYYTLALKWNKKVKDLSDDIAKSEILKFRERLLTARKKIDDLESQIFEMKFGFSKEQLDSMQVCNRKLYHSTYLPAESTCDPLISRKNHKHKKVKDRFPLFAASIEGNYFFGVDELESDLSVGTFITLNTSRLLGFGQHFELFFSYIHPKFVTNTFYVDYADDVDNMSETKWNVDLYSFGANLTFGDLLKHKSFNVGLKAGGGFFWGEGYADNVSNSYFDTDGGVVRGELTFSKIHREIPLELYFAYTGYILSDNLHFYDRAYRVEYDESYLQAFSFGLRFVFWNGYHQF